MTCIVMIDSLIQMQQLLARLKVAVPLEARLTPRLLVALKDAANVTLESVATITSINYAGDEGGITCQLEIPPNKDGFHISITQLRFDPRLPLAREIAAYQKHREKKLRRQ